MIVGRVVNMIKSTKKSCFSGVIEVVSIPIRVEIGDARMWG